MFERPNPRVVRTSCGTWCKVSESWSSEFHETQDGESTVLAPKQRTARGSRGRGQTLLPPDRFQEKKITPNLALRLTGIFLSLCFVCFVFFGGGSAPPPPGSRCSTPTLDPCEDRPRFTVALLARDAGWRLHTMMRQLERLGTGMVLSRRLQMECLRFCVLWQKSWAASKFNMTPNVTQVACHR